MSRNRAIFRACILPRVVKFHDISPLSLDNFHETTSLGRRSRRNRAKLPRCFNFSFLKISFRTRGDVSDRRTTLRYSPRQVGNSRTHDQKFLERGVREFRECAIRGGGGGGRTAASPSCLRACNPSSATIDTVVVVAPATAPLYTREQDAQRILHKLRALTTDNRAIPAAARNLLFFFLLPPFLPPSPFFPLADPHPSIAHSSLTPPPLCSYYSPSPLPPLLSLRPSSAFRVSPSREEFSATPRRSRVSTRAAVACTRRYASSSTFVTSPPFVPSFSFSSATT